MNVEEFEVVIKNVYVPEKENKMKDIFKINR